MNLLLYLFLFLMFTQNVFADILLDASVYSYKNINKYSNIDMYVANNNTTISVDSSFANEYIYEKDKYKYLGTSFVGTIGLMFVGAAVLYAMPTSVTNWDRSDIHNLGANWWDNVQGGPVWDKDTWVLNYVMHPYFGAIYYMQAREAGFHWFESFLYSAAMSTFFWEFGIEAFAEKPSIQDLFVTPIVGSMVGEGFYQASYHIKKNDAKVWDSKFLGYTLLTLMDPGFLLIQRTSLKNYTAKSKLDTTQDQITQNYSTWYAKNSTLMLNISVPL